MEDGLGKATGVLAWVDRGLFRAEESWGESRSRGSGSLEGVGPAAMGHGAGFWICVGHGIGLVVCGLRWSEPENIDRGGGRAPPSGEPACRRGTWRVLSPPRPAPFRWQALNATR